MGQTGAGEDGQLLTAHQRVQSVNGADAGLNELVGVVAGCRVHGQTVDVLVFLGQQGRTAVNRLAHAVEHAAQHVGGHAQLQGMAQKTNGGVPQVDAGGAVKQLHHSPVAIDLQHLAAAYLPVMEPDLRQFVVGDALHVFHHHQGAGNFVNGTIFLHHSSSPAFLIRAAISRSISVCTCW